MSHSVFQSELDTFATNKRGQEYFLRWLADQLAKIKAQLFEHGSSNVKIDNAAVTNVGGLAAEAYSCVIPAGSFVQDNSEIRLTCFGAASGTSEKEVFISHIGGDVLETTDTAEVIYTGDGEPIEITNSMGSMVFSTADTWRVEIYAERHTSNTVTVLFQGTYDGVVTAAIGSMTFDFDTEDCTTVVYIRDNDGVSGTITKVHGSTTYRRAS